MMNPVSVDPATLAKLDEMVVHDRAIGAYQPTTVAVLRRRVGATWETLFVKTEGLWSFPEASIKPDEGIVAGLFRGIEEKTAIGSFLLSISQFCFRDELMLPGKRMIGGSYKGISCYYFTLRCAGMPHVRLDEADHKWLAQADAEALIDDLKKRHLERGVNMLLALQKASLA